MRKLIATTVIAGALLLGVAACGSTRTTSASDRVSPDTFDQRTTETVPDSSNVDGYTWSDSPIRAIVTNAFPTSQGWDQSCVFAHLEATYPTPSAFQADYDRLGADALVVKIGVLDCLDSAS